MPVRSFGLPPGVLVQVTLAVLAIGVAGRPLPSRRASNSASALAPAGMEAKLQLRLGAPASFVAPAGPPTMRIEPGS